MPLAFTNCYGIFSVRKDPQTLAPCIVKRIGNGVWTATDELVAAEILKEGGGNP